MSSAGQALGGIVGGVAGFMIGGPTGALYGAQIGITAGGIIDPPKGPLMQGPRLTDLAVQTAAYGTVMPRIHGTIANHGNVFWLEGGKLKEVARKQRSGGKGGGGSTVKTYSYFATCAITLADTRELGPIRGIRRIWTSQGLLYDAGSDDLETIIASNNAAKGFRLYLGTDDQLPDPRMQADLGVENCPAFRGRAYIVFYDFALEKFANSLQGVQFKFEIVGAGEGGNCPYRTQLPNSFPLNGAIGISVGYESDALLVGTQMGSSYRIDRWTVGGKILGTVQEMQPQVSANGFEYQFRVFSKNNPRSALYRRSFAGSSTNICVRNGVVCPTEFTIGGLGHHPEFVDIGEASFILASGGSVLKIENGLVVATYELGVSANNFGISASATHLYILAPTGPVAPFGEVWEFDQGLNVTGHWPGNFGFESNYTAMPWGVERRLLFGYIRGAGGSGVSGNNYLYLLHDNGTITRSCGTPGHEQAIHVQPAGLSDVWYSQAQPGATRPSYWWLRRPSMQPESVPLGTIVQRECLLSGSLTAGDLDVSLLTQPVRGYRVNAVAAIRGGLQPLQQAWPFDVVQRGYKIHFIPRGRAPVMTIPAADLDARTGGSAPGTALAVDREMDTQLPRRVVIRFADIARNYDISEREDARQSTDSVHTLDVELAIALNSGEAGGMAEVLLRMYWLHRHDVAFTLPPSYRALEAGDVVAVVTADAQYELMLVQANLLSDGRVECRAKFNAAGTYTAAQTGDDSIHEDETLGLEGPAIGELLDIPRITADQDGYGMPAAMTGISNSWPGGLLFRTPDSGQTWVDLQAWQSPVTMGSARTALHTGRSDIVDARSTMVLDLYSGDIESITLEALLNYSNLVAIGVPGRWEICCFQTAVLRSDGGYDLRDFVRGLYGTEWAMSMHQAGDLLVLLTDPDMALIAMAPELINVPRGYRAITAGRPIDSTGTFERTYTGVNYKPLNPVWLNGSRHPSTRDWTLTWLRRGRIDAGWLSGVDVPLGEATEAYEVDIYDGAGFANVVRTLQVASPTATYTSAEQVTDFGSDQATLHVRVYQMSATVGRGYPLQASITRG